MISLLEIEVGRYNPLRLLPGVELRKSEYTPGEVADENVSKLKNNIEKDLQEKNNIVRQEEIKNLTKEKEDALKLKYKPQQDSLDEKLNSYKPKVPINNDTETNHISFLSKLGKHFEDHPLITAGLGIAGGLGLANMISKRKQPQQ